MEPAVDQLRNYCTLSDGVRSSECKRMKLSTDGENGDTVALESIMHDDNVLKKQKSTPNVVDFSDPSAVSNMLQSLDSGKYGSVTKDIEALHALKMQILGPYFEKYPTLKNVFLDVEYNQNRNGAVLVDQQADWTADKTSSKSPVVIIDSDDEDMRDTRHSYPFQNIVLNCPPGQFFMKHIAVKGLADSRPCIEDACPSGENDVNKDKGLYVGVDHECDAKSDIEDDGLDDIWKEMSFALETSKDVAPNPSAEEQMREGLEDCDHSFILKDDIGYVCRICGVVDRAIDTIFEFQFGKVKRSTRTYASESRNGKESELTEIGIIKFSEDDLSTTEIYAHPRHMKQMKPHQIEGFNFLVRNLVGDNPGGCILAHAPGSGKTFMLISFMQSFLAKYPNARPLVVLPKGILSTWQKEFKNWQVEDIPLFDFYSVKADKRHLQLEILKRWVEQKSVLFLGYKQFSTVICDSKGEKASISCREILLEAPSLLIMDEGHTPRNECTDVLQSLAKVQTPRKVILSGTLYQNHVKEVFNILNLVRPKFLRMETSRSIVKRIMSRVEIPGIRKQFKSTAETAFYDLVEHTLQKDKDFKRKTMVIHELREMTSQVLHYYKGDFLDDLPGLVDFTVLLNLSHIQKHETEKLKKLGEFTRMGRKFKISCAGSAVYLHPKLSSFPENCVITDDKIDDMLVNLNVKDGVKAKFFLSMLSLCESTCEKLLVFSQYLLPLKFLERLAMSMKGWSPGREIFMISGESSAEHREWSMDRFNNSSSAKVFFGSIKACGEGISLVGASRIIVLDVPMNPSVTRQAVGRAFRPGQNKKVFVYRLIAADTPEEEDHHTCFKKELISKMWFEWNERCGYNDFEVDTIDIKECGDDFLESSTLGEDVKLLYRR